MPTTTAFLASGDDALVALGPTVLADPALHETTVAVEAYSVNRGELLLLQGGRVDGYGKDVAGTVVEAAADGSGPPVGTRVVAHLDGGGWAERVVVPAARLVPLPDDVSAADAATLPLPGLTALRLLRIVREEGAHRVLLTGASGGVGHLLCELAADLELTAVVGAPDRGRHLKAAHVVHDIADAGAGFDVALDSVGGPTTGAALRALRTDGLLVWFGQAGGQPAALDFFAVMAGPVEVRLRNFVYWRQAERDVEDLRTLVALLAGGRLHPEIGVRASWRDTPQVLADLRQRRVRGNAVLEVAA